MQTRNVLRGWAEPDEDRSIVTLCDGVRLHTAQRAVGRVVAAIRPERMRILQAGDLPAYNVLSGPIVRHVLRATRHELEVDVGILVVVSCNRTHGEESFRVGQTIRLHVPDDAIHLIPAP